MKFIKTGIWAIISLFIISCAGNSTRNTTDDHSVVHPDSATQSDSLKLVAGKYSNDIIGYRISYPKDLLILEEGRDSAEEQVFLPHEGKAKLRIYKDERKDKSGNLLTFNQAFDLDKTSSKDRQISYNSLQPLFYSISGVEGKEIFYQKTIVSKGALVTAKLTYTKEEKPIYDAMIEGLFGSFR